MSENTQLHDTLRAICYENGTLLEMEQCRAGMINHLILENGLGVDEAEDTADKFIRECGLWPVPELTWDTSEPETTDSSTPSA